MVVRSSERGTMNYSMLFLSVGLIVIGYFGGHFVKRREFYRTNQSGVQEFKSYAAAAMSSSIEGLIRRISKAFLIIGVLFLVAFLVSMGYSSDNTAATN